MSRSSASLKACGAAVIHRATWRADDSSACASQGWARSSCAACSALPGPLACTLTHEGVTTNCFAQLDEDSALTELRPGDNVLSMQADEGASYLQAAVSFYPMEAGILPEPL